MAECSIIALWSILLHDLRCNNVGLNFPEGFSFEDRETSPPVGCTDRQYAAYSLLRSIPSKFQDEIDKDAADQAAWKLFHEANHACANWELRYGELGPYDEIVLGEFKNLVYDFFNPDGYPLLNHADMVPYLDFGPGSAPGADSCDFITKIGESSLTASSSLIISLYDEWLRDSPLRVDCEITRLFAMGPPVIVKASKMTAVPKKRSVSRLVKPEPLLNMFFQKGIAGILRRRLWDYFRINLTDQPGINAELARVGSIDGSLATIDLRSASDYLSVGLCTWCIPRASNTWLLGLRSPGAVTDRGEVQLHMMATMGNDFCFPLQTSLFACAVLAVYRALGIPIRKSSDTVSLRRDIETGEVISLSGRRILPNFGVFGDDIVVVDEAYGPVCRLLRCLGFIPNTEKSFDSRTGSFRESCGSDWISGFNVRGVYCRSLLTIQDRYALINNLVDWSARCEIALPLAIEYLKRSVPDVAVPPWENPDSGIRTPECCLKEQHKVFKCYKTHKGLELHGSYLYKRYVPVPHEKSCDFPEEESKVPTADCFWNSSAVFLAAIKGHCRSRRVSLRQWETPYRKRQGVAPCWDYIPPSDQRYAGRKAWYMFSTAYFSD